MSASDQNHQHGANRREHEQCFLVAGHWLKAERVDEQYSGWNTDLRGPHGFPLLAELAPLVQVALKGNWWPEKGPRVANRFTIGVL